MSSQAVFTLLVTLIAAGLLISERLRADVVALLVMVALGLSGLLTPAQAFAGFSGSAVMTIIGISIISEGLRQSGVTHQLGRMMHRMGKSSEIRLILIVTLTSAGLSLFMNNIAAVGVLLPAVMSLTRRSRVPPSRLLLPLAYGTTLGGMATLLTTSNIVVSGALRDAGQKPFGLLDFLPIGIPIVIVGAVYMVTLGRRLMPTRHTAANSSTQKLSLQLANLYDLGSNLNLIEILPGSPLANRTIAEGDWTTSTSLTILGLVRKQQTILAPSASEYLFPGDRLLVMGDTDDSTLLTYFLRESTAQPTTDQVTNEAVSLAEVVVAPHSALIGRTLRSERFRDRYGVNVLSIWSGGQAIQAGISDKPLNVGDALLIQGTASQIRLFNETSDLVLLEEDPDVVLRPGKNVLALTITLIALGIASFDILPTPLVILAGALLMILTGCLEMSDIYRSMEWKAIFLIAGMWPLSIAIRQTGLADWITQSVLNLGGLQTPLIIAGLLILVALIFTQFMSGQVASLVLAPLALSAAAAIGADPRALGMAVALGCSLAFPTPYGHPVNLMVMSPGGYTFKDYARVGLPLTVLIFVTLLLGLHFFWGL